MRVRKPDAAAVDVHPFFEGQLLVARGRLAHLDAEHVAHQRARLEDRLPRASWPGTRAASPLRSAAPIRSRRSRPARRRRGGASSLQPQVLVDGRQPALDELALAQRLVEGVQPVPRRVVGQRIRRHDRGDLQRAELVAERLNPAGRRDRKEHAPAREHRRREVVEDHAAAPELDPEHAFAGGRLGGACRFRPARPPSERSSPVRLTLQASDERLRQPADPAVEQRRDGRRASADRRPAARTRALDIWRTMVPCLATARKPEPTPPLAASKPRKHWPGMMPRKCAAGPDRHAVLERDGEDQHARPTRRNRTRRDRSATNGLCANSVTASPSSSMRRLCSRTPAGIGITTV